MIHHVYANQSNVGDWLSALGIQSRLAAFEVQEHFCDGPFAAATLEKLRSASPGDLVVIGGGGLFMDYFAEFWDGFQSIAERVPFVIWGVGACDLKRQRSRLSPARLQDIVRRARLCVVRDDLTRELVGLDTLAPPLVCPSVLAVPTMTGGGPMLLHADHYDSIGADNFERLVEIAAEFARRTGRSLRRTNNLINRGRLTELRRIVALYAAADLVLSSRLHGCIIALAAGRRVLAISGDRKVESFMRAAGLDDWVMDVAQIDSVLAPLGELHRQPPPTTFIAQARAANAGIGEAVATIAREQEVALA
jgi:hypothetical protein